MNDNGQGKGFLSGYRTLDLTDEKGMFCSRLLADMGAGVIRVEKAGETEERSPFFIANNLGKRSVTLDLESAEGQRIFKRLVETADIVIESFSPGYLTTLGLGYAELSAVNPGLVMVSITGFGQSGPYRDYVSGDLVASALGGWMYVSGELGMPPLKPFGHQACYSAGLTAAVGVQLALWHRHTSGRGQHLDISLQEYVVANLDHVLVRYFYQGEVAGRQGSLYWNNAFRIFPCRDGYILLSLFHQWETLVEWLADEDMAGDLTDQKWLDAEKRRGQLEHIIEVLESWTKNHTVAELVEKGQLMRFPWAEVSSIPQLIDNPQLRERDFFVKVTTPLEKEYKFPGALAKLSRSPWKVGSRAPVPGEDNTEVYRGELGLSTDEIEALAEKGVV